MNPVVTVQPDTNLVTYELTEEDIGRLNDIVLVEGGADGTQIGMNMMCVMQAVSLLSGAPSPGDEFDQDGNRKEVGYAPVCASHVIAGFMVEWNDGIDRDEREKLKVLVAEGILLNTRPVVRTTHTVAGVEVVIDKASTNRDYQNAEKRRRTILSKVDIDTNTFEEVADAVRRACNEYRVLAAPACGAAPATSTTDTSEVQHGEEGTEAGS